MPKKTASASPAKSVLVSAAKAIGTTAGKLLTLTAPPDAAPRETTAPEHATEGRHAPAVEKPSGKLPPKDKHRLPRREKKAQQRASEHL